MGHELRRSFRAGVLILLSGWWVSLVFAQGDAKRGEYISKAAGCLGCHTDTKDGAVTYAGGRALKTPFGTFYGPNITPHPQAGIGKWTEAEFIRALRHGKRPDGANYFPAFPYPSFTGMTDGDMRDLFAYLRTLPANGQRSRRHDVGFPYNVRFLVTFWKWLYFTPGAMAQDPKLSPALNRGKYLTTALGHCGECHTPRNSFGAQKRGRFLAGSKGIPNLTPTGLKDWSDEELKELLVKGETPLDGPVSKEMYEVVQNTTSQLTASDINALIAYLRSLPALSKEPQ